MSATAPNVPVQVVEVVRDDPVAIIMEFLDSIDARMLESDALEALAWDGDVSLSAAIIAQLKRYVVGG